jgi:HD superfamily phosphohydrolase
MLESNEISLDDDPEMHQKAIKLISSLITGDCEMWHRLLKPSEFYLTEIVSNKFCNIDVDKLDYLLRDNYYVNHVKILPFKQFFTNAQVVFDNDGYSHIAYHADDFPLIENMFINRANYHNEVYQHQNVAGIEKHIQDICQLASEGGFKIANIPLTELQRDCDAYLQLDDTVLDLIRVSKIETSQMREAQILLRHLDNDEFYKFIDENIDKKIYKDLINKFGDIFCEVKKVIPSASIPANIPLYDEDGCLTRKISKHNLSYQSVLIYCKAFDATTQQSIINFLDENNNNNNNNSN